jgi:hypothetical protein
MPEGTHTYPTRFFAWVLVLSIPFYIWGVFWPVHGLPLGLPAMINTSFSLFPN